MNVITDKNKNVLGQINDGIQIINIIDLMELTWPGYWTNTSIRHAVEKEYDYFAQGDKMLEHLKSLGYQRNDIHWYCQPEENFSDYVAYRECKEKNAKILILENLS